MSVDSKQMRYRTGTDEELNDHVAGKRVHDSRAEVAVDEDDAILEQMLSKAQQLASEMKQQSVASSASGSLAGIGNARVTGSVPATIEMKDSATECSSVGHVFLSTEHFVKKRASGFKEQTDSTAEKSVHSTVGSRMAPDQRGENKSCDDDSAAGKASVNISLDFTGKKTSQVSYSTSSSSLSQADVVAAVQAAQEMQKQMEAAIKASPGSVASIDMHGLNDPLHGSPSPTTVGAQSLVEEIQGFPNSKCFIKSIEGSPKQPYTVGTVEPIATNESLEKYAKKPEKFRSGSSSSLVSQEDVIAAINAANEMQKQLEAVLRISFRSDITEESGKNEAPVSPIPVQPPPDVGDRGVWADSITTKPTATASTKDKSENKVSQYDVAVADYTKQLSPMFAARHQNEGVTWEKVSSADEGDDDFVPIRDYSKSLHASKMQGTMDPIFKQPTYSEQRAAVRNRRRKRRRRMAVIFLATAFFICFYLIRRFSGNEEQVEAAVEPVQVEPPLPGTTPPSPDLITEDTNAKTVVVDFEVKGWPTTETTSILIEDTHPVGQIEKQICNFPFASLLSPICQSKHTKQVTDSHARAQARREKVEQLIEVMMQ